MKATQLRVLAGAAMVATMATFAVVSGAPATAASASRPLTEKCLRDPAAEVAQFHKTYPDVLQISVGCSDNSPNAKLSGTTTDGRQKTSVVASRYGASSEASPRVTSGAVHPDSAPQSCTIESELDAFCEWDMTWEHIDGETGEVLYQNSGFAWFSLFPLLNYVQVNGQVCASTGTINVMWDLTLYRMQGLLSPTEESNVSNEEDGAGQGCVSIPSGGQSAFLARSDPSAGIYSINFNPYRIYDPEGGAWFDMINNDEYSPRFECPNVNDPDYPQCRYPNGQEAPVF